MVDSNPVGRINELAQQNAIGTPKFSVILSAGRSHDPRFLCQWTIGTVECPAVLSKSKSEGKKLSAQAALDKLNILPGGGDRNTVSLAIPELDRKVNICRSLSVADPVTNDLLRGWEMATVDTDTSTGEYMSTGEYGSSVLVTPLNRLVLAGADAASTGSARASTTGHGSSQANIPLLSALQTSVGTTADSHDMDVADHAHLADGDSAPPPHVGPNFADADKFADLRSDVSTTPAPISANQLAYRNISTSPYPSDNIPDKAMPLTIAVPPVQSHVPAASSPNFQNRISTLNEMSQKVRKPLEFKEISRSGPSHCPVFTYQCKFGEEVVSAEASSVKECKIKCGRLMLAQIQPSLHRVTGASSPALLSGTEASPTSSPLRDGKNPISELMEYGAKLSIRPEFEITQDTAAATLIPIFYGRCQFGDKRFGPVQGSNKKEVRTAIARLALDELKSDNIDSKVAAQKLFVNSDAAETSRNECSGSDMNTDDVLHLLEQKHPISAFLEFGQKHKKMAEFFEVPVADKDGFPRFAFKCLLDGQEFPTAEATKKKQAREDAARLALHQLTSARSSPVPSSRGRISPRRADNKLSIQPVQPSDSGDFMESCPSQGTDIMPKHDKVVSEVLKKFESLKSQSRTIKFQKVILAGFVMEESEGEYTAVSLGTGNTVIHGQNLTNDGCRVHDCHAEIVARRGLLRFLYNNLRSFSPGSQNSIFEHGGIGGKLKLKPAIKLHLYISTAPCGDGAIFSHNETSDRASTVIRPEDHTPVLDRQSQGQLRSKIEDGMGTLPNTSTGLQTYDGIVRGDRLRTMSCSDKICKWNYLGLQGTLLSAIIQPIYLDSLVLGQLFHPGHLCRALCCRVRVVRDLVVGEDSQFRVNCPTLASGQPIPRSNVKPHEVSMNWALGDQRPEFVSGPYGMPLDLDSSESIELSSRPSRVSRSEIYKTFKQVCEELRKEEFLQPSYSQTKAAIAEYSSAKERLYQIFLDKYKTSWMKKPLEVSSFS